MSPVNVKEGDGPVILGLPHAGTFVPPEVAQALNERGQALADTDWHVDQLYDGLLPGATYVRANFHRYVIDANRDPAGVSLYPGQNTTTLVPLTDFDGAPIWNQPPSTQDIAAQKAAFHSPYHAALAEQIARVKARHGVAILFDCHSIRSRIPFLFDGVLPDLNVGTNGGLTCAALVQDAVWQACEGSEFSAVLNGRFKGGWTTRHYGQPEAHVHAIQLELAQSTYLTAEEPPWSYDSDKALKLRGLLRDILTSLADLAPSLTANPTSATPKGTS
ncbi:N-formylglutamate deformylase [Tropicibacter sp. R15_0]|uniref:N-formylglutamate deformylase n=1 Tax=Tropicibacter sp. R15_0 TaxID=2821101 RepID=UPI001ADC770F|nr:N-formylglutamate deformylase [Tropicibacter sp. R15_0]MBO9467104.1 N-formylglutamate deformylase [Tropicibacter sp. R15_0]